MDLIRKTKLGKVEGFSDGTVNRWFGIPYGLPPVGERRFKRSAEAESWEGVKKCLKMSPRPYDFLDGMMKKMGKLKRKKKVLIVSCLKGKERNGLSFF